MPEIFEAEPLGQEARPIETIQTTIPSNSAPDSPPAGRRLRRGLLQAAGLFFSGLAIAGVVLPLVPTTPFLLLAGACFARSSPRLHHWLLSNPVFGSYLEQWQRDRTVSRVAKRKAYLVVVLSFGVSIALVHTAWIRLLLLALGACLLAFLIRLPSERSST